MKLSPLLLFLLLVLILVVTVIVCKNCAYPLSEGFVSYAANVEPSKYITIPQYSNTSVIKMFDNLFFDNKNGNVIEVDSSRFLGNVNAAGGYLSGNIDIAGSSISNLYISTRDDYHKTYSTSTSSAIPEANIATVTSSYKNWNYTTKCQNTRKYQLFYVPWNMDTYVHIIQYGYTNEHGEEWNMDLNTCTYKFSGNSSTVLEARYGIWGASLPLQPPFTNGTDPSNNTFVIDPYYGTNNPVYQLSPGIKFDASNANLIINSTNSITVYGRSKNVILTTSQPLQNAGMNNTIKSINYIAWIVYDAAGRQVVYVASGTNTLLLLFEQNSTGSYDLVNVARFNENGLDTGSPPPPPPAPPARTPTTPSTPPAPTSDVSGNAVSDYYKWYWYWNSVGGGNKYTDNYILKTQIVPPVCPKCPNCPNCTGTCTNCGGQGGSGTMITDGTTTNTGVGAAVGGTASGVGAAVGGTALGAGVAVGGAAIGAGAAVGGTVGGAAIGAGEAVGGLATGAGNAVGGLASGAAGIVNNAISTTGSVANNLIDTAQGQPGYSQPGYGQPGYGQSGYGQPGYSKGNPPIDNYSYYGALPEKGANYMPITADFSKFGK